MTAAIITEGLTKRFGAVTAVDRLDLEVSVGEVFGFLGPNGAGKTTTIRLLLDILRPSAGRATVLGCPVGDVAVRRRIGFLPAELHLDRRHVVAEAIGFHGALRGGFDQRDVEALVDRFGLDPSRPIGDLSTGNRRKIGVVIAFAGRPELLILDEPSSGLDPLLQRELVALVEERVAEGATVFLSSHVLPEVERIAGRVAILRQGRLALLGSIAQLRARARQRVELHLASPAEPAVFDGVPGVIAVDAQGSVLTLTVEGSVDPALKRAAARLVVERIVTRDHDLEDVFLEVYR
jgi:beta-exotoxin I transport system ATP-binding protein